jgi:hypothetical protein
MKRIILIIFLVSVLFEAKSQNDTLLISIDKELDIIECSTPRKNVGDNSLVLTLSCNYYTWGNSSNPRVIFHELTDIFLCYHH